MLATAFFLQCRGDAQYLVLEHPPGGHRAVGAVNDGRVIAVLGQAVQYKVGQRHLGAFWQNSQQAKAKLETREFQRLRM